MSTDEERALMAWHGAARTAGAVLFEASKFSEDSSDGAVRSILVALHRLEAKIEGQLAELGLA